MIKVNILGDVAYQILIYLYRQDLNNKRISL